MTIPSGFNAPSGHAPPLPPHLVRAMEAALDQAREAAHAGEVPVGAIVLHDEIIVARAQNRMIRDGDGTSHAELLALREAASVLGRSRLTDCTLVVTLEPCAMCAGAIVLARVGHLVFGAWDDKAGMCGSVGDLVRHAKLNHQPNVRGGVMAQECGLLLTTFFDARRSTPVVQR